MSRTRSALFAPFLAASLVAAPALVRADDFYKGKTLTIIVGFTPGGGYDSYARALARFIPDHIPGHPTVIVQNEPGAGSLVAVRSLNFTQPKDGTVMVTFNPGLITQSVVQPEMVNLDFRKYAWVGIATPDFRVCYGYGPNGVSSWDDMMHRKEFILGGTGKGSGNYINGATLREVFDAPVKQVLGFPGSAEMRLAIERGELDGDCGSLSSIPAEWLRDNMAHPFVRFTKERAAGDAGKRPFHRGLRHHAGSEGSARRAGRRGRGGAVVRDVRGRPRRSARDLAKGLRRHHEGPCSCSPRRKKRRFRCIP